ncbi:hypothetical protein [Streptomyces sp. NBC_01794]|uniref:hypothetical protein n=1 Tax=Streptomyces sp. NBC_01794 TaxID=2975942 RepID=UPI003086810A|nr:ABC transporter permease [Streptomyces sp. NBC_01794]
MTAAPATPHAPPRAESAVLRCTDLVRPFGERTVVDGVSFGVAPGRTARTKRLIGFVPYVLLDVLLVPTHHRCHQLRTLAVGAGVGMLGGCMWPLALVPGWLRTAGHAVPHAWAVDAWTVLLSQNGGVTDILRNLIILSAFAAALLTLASFGLRRQLTGAAPGTRS